MHIHPFRRHSTRPFVLALSLPMPVYVSMAVCCRRHCRCTSSGAQLILINYMLPVDLWHVLCVGIWPRRKPTGTRTRTHKWVSGPSQLQVGFPGAETPQLNRPLLCRDLEIQGESLSPPRIPFRIPLPIPPPAAIDSWDADNRPMELPGSHHYLILGQRTP